MPKRGQNLWIAGVLRTQSDLRLQVRKQVGGEKKNTGHQTTFLKRASFNHPVVQAGQTQRPGCWSGIRGSPHGDKIPLSSECATGVIFSSLKSILQTACAGWKFALKIHPLHKHKSFRHRNLIFCNWEKCKVPFDLGPRKGDKFWNLQCYYPWIWNLTFFFPSEHLNINCANNCYISNSPLSTRHLSTVHLWWAVSSEWGEGFKACGAPQ